VAPDHARLVTLDADLETLLARFETWTPPAARWVGPPTA